MKVSYKWVSDYVDLTGFSAGELAEKLNRTGIAVDVVENRNKGVTGVVVGYVKSREKHPDADKLSVCIVDAGQGEDLQIVCGAKNVDAGQKVPVALVGAELPGDLKIKRAKLRGVESQGMICSAKELGLNDKLLPKEIQEGILVLPQDTPIGQSILDVLAINDEVIELDLTPNRSDCLSMIGAAYELAAITGREVKLADPQEGLVRSPAKAADHIRVTISAPEQCSHYAARLIEGVKVAPSPLWLQNRLMAAGIRPINNVVDITNYVMLEYGQPLHAFDADKLANGRIDVRMAQPGEVLVTLDDNERKLEPHMLLITDGVKPVGLAGVMGGANSEVTEGTTRILLESARFDGGTVRKTSRQLGLRSEASIRFEKEVNPDHVIPALDRAAALLSQYAEGQVAEGIVEEVVSKKEPYTLELSLERVNRFLGTSLSFEELKNVFDRLSFSYEVLADESVRVQVPLRRGDITRPVDLIEEAARLYGYDKIPTTLIEGVTTPGGLTPAQAVRRSVRRLLSGLGLQEAITYSFTDPDQIKRYPGLYPEAKPIALSLPMSEERSTMRTSLIPHLLDATIYNRNRNTNDVALFELGTVFVTDEERVTKLPQEKLLLGIAISGSRRAAHWAEKSKPVDFYDLKGMFEQVIAHLGIPGIEYQRAQADGMHPGRTADIVAASGTGTKVLGRMGQLHPALQKELDLDDTYVLEVELDALTELVDTEIAYHALPRYPAMARDLAVVVDRGTEVGELLRTARETAGELLESIDVFDIYTDDRLGGDKKSVALALVYRHAERTLTDDEVTALQDKIIVQLAESHQAELRK
jgi:phenylalanyl-tRNA synthetase beta chain